MLCVLASLREGKLKKGLAKGYGNVSTPFRLIFTL